MHQISEHSEISERPDLTESPAARPSRHFLRLQRYAFSPKSAIPTATTHDLCATAKCVHGIGYPDNRHTNTKTYPV